MRVFNRTFLIFCIFFSIILPRVSWADVEFNNDPAGQAQQEQDSSDQTPLVPNNASSSGDALSSSDIKPADHTSDEDFTDSDKMTLIQRVQRLEHLQQNLHALQLTQQIQTLQDQVQQLQGRLEVAEHQIQLMKAQVPQVQQAKTATTSSDNTSTTKPIAPASTLTRTTPSTSSSNASVVNTASKDDLKEQQAYKQAFDDIKQRHYADATKDFKNYLSTYPEGKYLANANYWLGELSLMNNDELAAKNYFTIALDHAPSATKAATAHLKLAQIAHNQKQMTEEQNQYQLIIQEYPDSQAAITAKKHLAISTVKPTTAPDSNTNHTYDDAED